MREEKKPLREKIFCLERAKGLKHFDKIHPRDIRDMIGWIEPPDDDGKWDVSLIYEGEGYSTKNQSMATVIASLEEVKAMLIKLVGGKNG